MFSIVSESDLEDEGSNVDYEMEYVFLPPEPSTRNLDIALPALENLDPDILADLQRQDQGDIEAMHAFLPPDSYSFDWSSDISRFHGIRETFTGTPGPTFDPDEMGKPVDAFLKIFDSDFVELIARETNRYADQCIARGSFTSKNYWVPTDKEEMYVFLALLMHQGLSPRTVEKDYFYSDSPTAMPYLSQVMEYNRFLLLKKFLHFINNESLSSDVPLLVRSIQKVQPVLDYLSNKFESLYLPEQEISLDESLLGYKGRLGLIKSKAGGASIKSFELCESKTGYLWKFQIYTGKTNFNQAGGQTKTNPDQEDMTDMQTGIDYLNRQTNLSGAQQNCPIGSTAKIVYDLTTPLFQKGYTLIMENFYNSPLLARCLKKNGMDCMGTLRLNRQFVPGPFKSNLKKELREGEVVFSNCGDLNIMVWLDKNLVSMLSTYHRAEIGAHDKYATWTYKPHIIQDYNTAMGGLDRKDQLLADFPMERRGKLKVFRRLLNVSVQNAFVMFSWKLHTENKCILNRTFRIQVAEDLLKLFCHSQIDRPVKTVSRIAYKKTLRPILQGNHYLVPIGKRSRCMWCPPNTRARTNLKCDVCDVALCLQCMKPYHTQLNL